MKFILPILVLSAIVAFAFGNRALNTKKVEASIESHSEKPLATTYFVFTGTLASQYTDSTKWVKHTSMPSTDCEGESIACIVSSQTLSSRSQLATFIQGNNGVISGSATIQEKKN